MSDPIRFHLDEHVDPEIADALRRYRIDVTTTVETGLRTYPDEAHIRFFRSMGRVIVTDDRDFVAFAAATLDHPGVVICQRHNRSKREIIRGLKLIHDVLKPEDMVGRIEWL